MGALYFQNGSPGGLQAALKWDPANPQYYDVLATMKHLYADADNPGEIVHLYREAVRLSPYEARLWSDLASAYDWAGRRPEAFACYRRAQLLFPNSPEIHWRLANLYLRDGQTSEGLRTLQEVLVEDNHAQREVFVLASRSTSDDDDLLKQLLPNQAPILFAYLDFELERSDTVGAERVWKRIAQTGSAFALQDTFPYLDFLVQHRQVDQLEQSWAMLAARFPAQIGPSVTVSNLVTNDSFKRAILNGGLDWRIVPTDGVVVSLESGAAVDGVRALRITFDGSRNLNYTHVFQYVPVQPSRRYRFSAQMRAQGITTDSGPRFQICDAYHTSRPLASTENLVGTSNWLEQHADLITGSDTRLLLISVVRPASSMLDNKVSGSLWIHRVRLKEHPSPFD